MHMSGPGDTIMDRSARSFHQPRLWIAATLAVLPAVIDQGAMSQGNDPAARPIVGVDRVVMKQYAERGEQIALRVDEEAAASRENAAFLYYQALLAQRTLDPNTRGTFTAVQRGAPPTDWTRVYLGHCLTTLTLAQYASQMPQCYWGPLWAGEQRLDLNLALPLRRLGYLLNVDARTLAADGHCRAALARSLTIRRLAHHTGDETYTLFTIAQGMNTMALRALEHVLNTMSADAETILWLQRQLATTPGVSFQPEQALRKWRDAELRFWRTRPRGHVFKREMVTGSLRDETDKKEAAALTDEQLLVIALQQEQMAPGRYGISAPPQLLERAQKACDEYLASAVQTMKADLPYRDKHTRLQEMVDSLDLRAALGDPISLLSEAPKEVASYHALMTHNAVCDNALAAVLAVYLVKINTGQLPATLPDGLPKDLYSGRDFGYERTDGGFVLRFDPQNVSKVRLRQFEFKPPSGSPAKP